MYGISTVVHVGLDKYGELADVVITLHCKFIHNENMAVNLIRIKLKCDKL